MGATTVRGADGLRPGGFGCRSAGGPTTFLMMTLALALTLGVPRADAVEAAGPVLQLVESVPLETPLDHPEMPEAHEVWLEMIADARDSLAFAEFYASNAPGSRLEPIIAAIEAAATRGVVVRFLAEEKFYRTYPGTLDRLAAHPGIEVRRYDVASLMGGVLHAKYFLVDGREAFLGSQNLDWRALTHILSTGRRREVLLDAHRLESLWHASERLEELARLETPPHTRRIRLCKTCSLAGFCGWE